MFTNQPEFRHTSKADSEALEERQVILQDVLNSLNARIQELPYHERRAACSRLCQEVTDAAFDLQLSLLASAARRKIAKATDPEAKRAVLHEFRSLTDDLAFLHGIGT